ncbi:MAG: hypothetical protein DMG72_01470 [Acidobacteria bacterium]|nr:MAG: hypothetical protein DMG72_01470 [Acidobacteriota bacterium]
MGGLIQPSPSTDQRDTNWTTIGIGVAFVVVVIAIIALLSRSEPKSAKTPHPYISNIKLSNIKMSAAENFVGASVTYIDGTITNTGDKTLTHVMVHVTFKDSMGQVAQTEDVPLHVLQTGGPYPDAVDLNASPLAPGQSKPFRLTFESISAQWNHEYPELQITDVTVG